MDESPSIVVLDDDESTRRTTCELLERAGYRAFGVSTPAGLRQMAPAQPTILCQVSPPRTFHQIVELSHAVRAAGGDGTTLVLHGSQPAVQLSILVRACAAAGFVERTGDAEVSIGMLQRFVPRAVARRSIRVLLIDDDELTLEVLQSRLRASEYDVRIALSLGEVQSIIQGWQPAVIVADVNMPDMRGDDLCARLKAAAATRDAIVLLCSSMADAELGVAARAAGADGWVSKDKGVEQVVACLEAAFRRAAGRRSA